jgi:hypothetical protein
VYFLDIGLQLGVHSGLGSLALRGGLSGGLGGAGGEQSSLALLLGNGVSLEERVVDLGHVNAVEGHLGGGGHNVLLVHSAQRDTVHGVGAYGGAGREAKERDISKKTHTILLTKECSAMKTARQHNMQWEKSSYLIITS